MDGLVVRALASTRRGGRRIGVPILLSLLIMGAALPARASAIACDLLVPAPFIYNGGDDTGAYVLNAFAMSTCAVANGRVGEHELRATVQRHMAGPFWNGLHHEEARTGNGLQNTCFMGSSCWLNVIKPCAIGTEDDYRTIAEGYALSYQDGGGWESIDSTFTSEYSPVTYDEYCSAPHYCEPPCPFLAPPREPEGTI